MRTYVVRDYRGVFDAWLSEDAITRIRQILDALRPAFRAIARSGLRVNKPCIELPFPIVVSDDLSAVDDALGEDLEPTACRLIDAGKCSAHREELKEGYTCLRVLADRSRYEVYLEFFDNSCDDRPPQIFSWPLDGLLRPEGPEAASQAAA